MSKDIQTDTGRFAVECLCDCIESYMEFVSIVEDYLHRPELAPTKKRLSVICEHRKTDWQPILEKLKQDLTKGGIAMSELKCPFCDSELVREGSNNYWCKKCNLERYSPALYGSQKLWQELIRTRKELDVALKCMGGVVKDLPWVKRALDEIAALEQKEHFADTSKKIEQKDE